MRRIAQLLAVVTALHVAMVVQAASPAQIPIYGTLADADGQPVNATVDASFAIYTDAGGNAVVWSESQTIDVTTGAFAAYLGDSTPMDLALFRDYSELYLGVRIGSDEEMPLVRIASAPFAGYATFCGEALTVEPGAVNVLFADFEQRIGDTTHTRYTDAEAVAAMGPLASTNPLNHDRFSPSEAVAAMGAKAIANPLHHDRYADGEAVAAMGAEGPTNPLNHARYTDAEAVAAVSTADDYLSNSSADAMVVSGDARLTIHSATDAPTANSALLSLQTGATSPTTRFSVDAEGDTVVGGNLDVGGTLNFEDRAGPHGYREFTTDLVVSPTTSALSTIVANIRCSGHWGSYAVEIDLVTSYYLPGVRRYTYYCGNSGNYTGGGVLTELSATNSGYGPGGLATLTLEYLGFSGYQQSGIDMHDARLVVNQPAYAQTYMRVRAYGAWESRKAGTALSTTSPFVVWETWN